MRQIYGRLLYWAFERLYHELAWTYDLVAVVVSRGYWFRWITAAVPYLRHGPVLELGCGTGHLQLELARAGISHVGYDASSQMLRQTRRRLWRTGAANRLLRGRGEALPFADQSFANVVATFPAPYILKPATLAEIRRVLQPDGQLLIVDGGQLDGGIYEAAVELAYRATLQDDEGDRYTRRLTRAGFAARDQRVRVGQSSVGIITAHVSPSEPNEQAG